METALTGWTRSTFEAAGLEREVWTKGSGPAVIVVHEVPGITPKVLAFAEEVVASGFTVAMPSLVGTPGREMSNKYAVRSLLKVCVAREFVSLATNRTSPVIAWLRALARDVHGRAGGRGVGAVGMCFSGGFALGMMVDDIMVAPVLSQPSLPFPVGRKRAADLNLSPDDAAVIAERAAGGCEVLGLRFTKDKLVGDRFSSLRTLLGDAFIAVEIPSEKPNDHSVLTEQRHDESVQRVLQFFRDKLL
ncbi:MAG: dienelactone hydrolase [Actinobacteria bacterium]|jgi:dienelactone hydrolase|nr:dienelactone hydrolase [Actinomycetota bacterium]